jgi:hypothetical protein
MAAVAHNADFAKKVDIPQSVGKEFNDADKAKARPGPAPKPGKVGRPYQSGSSVNKRG